MITFVPLQVEVDEAPVSAIQTTLRFLARARTIDRPVRMARAQVHMAALLAAMAPALRRTAAGPAMVRVLIPHHGAGPAHTRRTQMEGRALRIHLLHLTLRQLQPRRRSLTERPQAAMVRTAPRRPVPLRSPTRRPPTAAAPAPVRIRLLPPTRYPHPRARPTITLRSHHRLQRMPLTRLPHQHLLAALRRVRPRPVSPSMIRQPPPRPPLMATARLQLQPTPLTRTMCLRPRPQPSRHVC